MNVRGVAAKAKESAKEVARAPHELTRRALLQMADAIDAGKESIGESNLEDLKAAEAAGISEALLDRLTLNDRRMAAMSSSLRQVAELPGVVGEIIEEWKRPNGLKVQKVRVPLGVVAVIYEARPNVTADVAGLCIRSGNSVVLRGSSHALRTNTTIVRLLRDALGQAGLPSDAIGLIEDTSREAALELMRLDDVVDLLIPRGGSSLIQSIKENATVPYIIDGDGNCHVYVDRSADPETATAVIVNAKTSRPSVCNAAETLVVHEEIAAKWLPEALDALASKGVEIRGDEKVIELWPDAVPASDADWATEYLDLILAVKVVTSIDEAIDHINRWGTSNAEAIVAQDIEAADRFVAEVDSGSLFVNASTRFSDGGEFGFGSEIGISTQKLHARGPMGLRELTTYKYVARGTGQIRE